MNSEGERHGSAFSLPLTRFVPRYWIRNQGEDCCMKRRVRGVCFQRATHSYRSASTGSSFDARIAGTSPLITPTTSNTTVESTIVIMEMRR